MNDPFSIEFSTTKPQDFTGNIICISKSQSLPHHVYITVRNTDETVVYVFSISYNVHCSPFKQAILKNGLLFVGWEDRFYIFNIAENRNLFDQQLMGYFGNFQIDHDLVFICDCQGIICTDVNGRIIWENKCLAIDGVLINEITMNTILGEGECDPPGGWRNFVLDKSSGLLI